MRLDFLSDKIPGRNRYIEHIKVGAGINESNIRQLNSMKNENHFS